MHILFLMFIIFSISSATSSCGTKDKIQINHIKDIECVGVPFSSNQIMNRPNLNTSDAVFYYLSLNNEVGVYCLGDSINNGHKIRERVFSNKKLFDKSTSPAQFYYLSDDSLFFIDPIAKIIMLVDSSLEVIKSFNLSPNYTPVILQNSKLIVNRNNFYYSWIPITANFASKSTRIEYYQKRLPICEVDYSLKSVSDTTRTFGNFPISYQNSGKNYYDYFPNICVGSDQQIILSFGADDNIYIYNNAKSMIVKECKSAYINSFRDIPDKDFSDLAFIKKYQGEEPRYLRIIYDPYKNSYYRIVRHTFDMKNNDIQNANWSLIILNETFDVTGEVIFEYSEYLPDILIPSKNGIYLKKSPASLVGNSGNLFLSLVEILL